MEKELLAVPFMQYGFAGFCVLLLAVLVWMIRLVLDSHKNTLSAYQQASEALTEHTTKLGMLSSDTERLNTINQGLRDELLKRPCMVKER